jgi:topoisomerase-4 subunit B
MAELGKSAEVTRFKGLGEISPVEFGTFIGENIRLDPVILHKDTTIESLLKYYMGKNTPERQEHIIENLHIEVNDDPLGSDDSEKAA